MTTPRRAEIQEIRGMVADHAEQCPAGVFGTFRGENFADGRATALDESKPIDQMLTDPKHPIGTREAWKRVALDSWWDARHILVAAHLLGLEGFKLVTAKEDGNLYSFDGTSDVLHGHLPMVLWHSYGHFEALVRVPPSGVEADGGCGHFEHGSVTRGKVPNANGTRLALFRGGATPGDNEDSAPRRSARSKKATLPSDHTREASQRIKRPRNGGK
ncbi:unnamed protein product [Pylaiella littoralis]